MTLASAMNIKEIEEKYHEKFGKANFDEEINEVADYTDDNDDDDFDHLKPDPECKDSEEGQHGFSIQSWAGPNNGKTPGTCSDYAKLKYCPAWSDDTPSKIINLPCCTGRPFEEQMKKFCRKTCGFC